MGKRFTYQHNDIPSLEKNLNRATKIVENTGQGENRAEPVICQNIATPGYLEPDLWRRFGQIARASPHITVFPAPLAFGIKRIPIHRRP